MNTEINSLGNEELAVEVSVLPSNEVVNEQILNAVELEFLQNLAIKLELSEQQQVIMKAEVEEFHNNYVNHQHENNKQEILANKLEQSWGDSYESNLIFAKRGLSWLNINDLDDVSQVDEFAFINHMVNLGKMLSEDRSVKLTDVNNFQMSKKEAIKQRDNFVKNPKNLEALYNKSHPEHKKIMNKLNMFHETISKNNS